MKGFFTSFEPTATTWMREDEWVSSTVQVCKCGSARTMHTQPTEEHSTAKIKMQRPKRTFKYFIYFFSRLLHRDIGTHRQTDAWLSRIDSATRRGESPSEEKLGEEVEKKKKVRSRWEAASCEGLQSFLTLGLLPADSMRRRAPQRGQSPAIFQAYSALLCPRGGGGGHSAAEHWRSAASTTTGQACGVEGLDGESVTVTLPFEVWLRRQRQHCHWGWHARQKEFSAFSFVSKQRCAAALGALW